MVKPKQRKTRLDKGGTVGGGAGTTEFIGFGAFDAAPEGDPNVVGNASFSLNNSSSTWTPVYTGKDEQFSSLFSRIGQKRDAVTVCKGIQELQSLLADEAIHKRIQAEAILHWAWLYHTKLGAVEGAASVRAAALQTWGVALNRVPKAVATTITQTGGGPQQIELLGMMYAAQTDPATEVRAAAAASGKYLYEQSEWPWEAGVVAYTTRIFSFGRASAMHDALMPKRKNQAESDAKTELQRDAMEELYVRLVGNCLDCMAMWLQKHEDCSTIESSQSTLWWKTLTSPKHSLRCKTYQLLAVVSAKSPHLLPVHLDTLLPQAVSAEKEAANLPVLLETVLSVLVHSRKTSTTTIDTLVIATVKPLCKILQKACYGAKVELWGPIVLPMIAQFTAMPQQLQLLQAAVAGLPLTLGETDQWQLWAAVAESASFVLLRTRTTTTELVVVSDGDDDVATRTMALLWLGAFQFLVSTTSAKKAGPAAMARTRLLQDLAKHLVQLDDATLQRPNCAFYFIADWFWDERFSLKESQPAVLVELLIELRCRSSTERPVVVRILPQFRERFLSTLRPYQESSSAVPSGDAYGFIRAVFDYYGPLTVMGDKEATTLLEKFVMNDLLRWTVIHTSSLSTGSQRQTQNSSLVEQDFQILSCCLGSIPSTRPSLWGSFLREIVVAKSDVGLLVVGLSVLVQQSQSVAWLLCDTLNAFAIDLGRTAAVQDVTRQPEAEISDDESVDVAHVEVDAYNMKLEFCRICLGLASCSSSMLIGNEVLSAWIECACPSQSPSGLLPSKLSGPARFVLEALLQTIQEKRSVLSDDQVLSILLESWHSTDHFFEVYSAGILDADVSVVERFASVASQDLRNDLSCFLSTPSTDQSVRSWALRAWRLLRVCKDKGAKFPSPSIGIEDIDIWRKHPIILFQLSMSLFRYMEIVSDRMALIESWGTSDSANLIVDLLVSVSEASDDALLAARSRERKDRCAEFLSAVGGKAIDEYLVERLVRASIFGLSNELKQGAIFDGKIRSQVAVLSQLLDLMFDTVLPSDAGKLVEEDISEGDRLWYVTDPDNPEVREEALVVKVHYDSQAGYYLTIRVKRDGEPQERQTVVERLRKEQLSESKSRGKLMTSITDEEWLRRSSIHQLVWQELVAPYCSNITRAASLGELVNILVSQIGVGRDRGIGSSHYNIHRCVTSVEGQVLAALDKKDAMAAGNGLWTLSLALGFGLNAPGSQWTMLQIWVNPIPLTTKLVNYYEDHIVGTNLQFDCAVAAWLVVTGKSALDYQDEEGKTIERSLILIFQIVSRILETAHEGKFTGPALIACRAISEGVVLSKRKQNQKIHDDEAPELSLARANAFFLVVQAFATGWASEASRNFANSGSEPDWAVFSSFPQLVRSSRDDDDIRDFFAEASASSNAGTLCDALFIPSKRHFAFMLLDSISRSGKPLWNANDQVTLADQTSHSLKAWINEMDEEEAAELEEDVYIVAEWVPVQMMIEIESWADKGFEENDKSTIIGRLLTWLGFLRFVDAAAPIDPRNRPAFVSYLGKCGAASSILTLSLLHNEVLNDRKRKTMPTLLEEGEILRNESLLDVTQLATHSLFRTVEVLPSLSRRWWEDDCPKVYTDAVQSLVEKYVAPEILKRELERIKSAESFGAMTVTASLVSREVTATYVQDDFTLKVLIALPAAFPFRSAEVDCSKTLGVPQSRWKRWSLQITLMLNNQGGTLQDALMLWKGNVDKEFEGVEPCPVCYSVLHVKTRKLPSLECKTCHNRFHLDCLSQWFRSSGKSQCVLCQQPWQGTRIQ